MPEYRIVSGAIDTGETVQREGVVALPADAAGYVRSRPGHTLERVADEADDLTELGGVGPATASELRAAGYGTFDAIRAATVDDLGSVENVSESDAESFKEQLGSE